MKGEMESEMWKMEDHQGDQNERCKLPSYGYVHKSYDEVNREIHARLLLR